MTGVDLSEHAVMTYADGAGSSTEHFPTLAEAVQAYKKLNPHIQLTVVVTTHSGTYDCDRLHDFLRRTALDTEAPQGDPEGAS